ncbi:MAG: CoA-binding protein [Deltaproteobacteria bacterium]|nr:CoA-binding protein [Deltaproteobacteria bacterium]MBW1923370.1 CoA-binding protein [Deltaproteobacteria bacterium]
MGDYKKHFLHKFFHPESIAVVGATSNPNRLNHNLVANLLKLGYAGKIYPVHPSEGQILGLRAYPTVKHIEDVVDLAVISVSHAATEAVLQDCIAKGISRVTIVAGGFSETGEKGRALQSRIGRLLRENGIRAVGPNALSPLNAHNNLCISFFPMERLSKGRLSLIFQSGLYDPRFDWLTGDFNLPFNKLIDLGNKMDINEVDALSYLIEDPGTAVIGIHLESVEGDGREFLDLIREASRAGKRMVVLRSGRTRAGARAAASHTGAMVRGNPRLFDAALRQHGAIPARGIEDFFHLCRALERFGPVSLRGNRLFVATVSGGEGVLITDLCGQAGFEMAPLAADTLEAARRLHIPWEISHNPWDLGVSTQFNGPDAVFEFLTAALAGDPTVDGVAMQLPPMSFLFPKEFFSWFDRIVGAGKPVALWLAGQEAGRYEIFRWAEKRHVTIFSSPEKAIRALQGLHEACRRQSGIEAHRN